MITKGIRGAITVEENTSEAIGSATIKLLKEIMVRNNIETNLISHAIFTLTPDVLWFFISVAIFNAGSIISPQ